jgi:NAD(P)-dependent dehydrogenase (short-subunit alcohol dehydrogenase family)
LIERFIAKFQLKDMDGVPESVLNRAMAAGTSALGRLATAQEVADAAVWMCTKATFMSGQTLLIDGGYSCR